MLFIKDYSIHIFNRVCRNMTPKPVSIDFTEKLIFMLPQIYRCNEVKNCSAVDRANDTKMATAGGNNKKLSVIESGVSI